MLSPEKLVKAFAKVEEENWLLRAFLKAQEPDEVDKIVNMLHRELFAGFDCVACSNCCKTIVPFVETKEIQLIASKLGLTSEAYKDGFLTKTDEGFMIKEKPCPHLGVSGCSIYEYRPKNCREYPFTDKKDISERLINLVHNCSVCPVLFEIFERLKKHYKAEFAAFRAEQAFSWCDEEDDDNDFEGWEVEEELFANEDWAGLVEYRRRLVEQHPDDYDYQSNLGEAYVLNKEYGKAIFYLYDLHKKQPEDPNVQHNLLDALFAIGKDETAINWIVKPHIFRLNDAVLNTCYNFLKGKRKPRTVDDVYLELLRDGYVTFELNQLMNFLLTDNRFSVKGDNGMVHDCYVSVKRK